MKREIKKLENCKTEVVVSFEKEEWTKAYQKAFAKAKSEVTVKGFRKGKAPDHLAAEHVNSEKVFNAAIDALLPLGYESIVKEEKIIPVIQPSVSVESVDDNGLALKFVIVTEPTVELGAYKDLKIGNKNAEKITDKQLEDELTKLASDNATLVVVDREVKEGDTVVIDFEGFLDGKPFDGGKADNYELVIGSHYFIPGFEEQIVGHKAGDKFDLNVKFPEQYMETLAGKDGVFKVVLHEVKEKVLPEINDEYVKSLGLENVSNIAEFKESKRKELEVAAANQAKNAYTQHVLEKICENSKFDIAPEILDNEVQARRQDLESRMQQSGFTIETYLQALGQSEDDFNAKLKEEAEKNVKIITAMKAIAAAEKIVVTDADIDAKLQELATDRNMKLEDVKKALGNNIEQYRFNLVLEKVENLVVESNN